MCGGVIIDFGGEFGLLKFGIGVYVVIFVVMGEFEYVVIEVVEISQGYELEFVVYGIQFMLVGFDGCFVEIGFLVEGW